MKASQVWELFEKTGNVGVYMLYKKLSEEENSALTREDNSTYADSDRGNGN